MLAKITSQAIKLPFLSVFHFLFPKNVNLTYTINIEYRFRMYESISCISFFIISVAQAIVISDIFFAVFCDKTRLYFVVKIEHEKRAICHIWKIFLNLSIEHN